MKLSPKKTSFNLALGKRGEMLACNFLLQKGYKILNKNYTCRLGEIDVIVSREENPEALIFVEIKTRKSSHFGRPEEAVHYFKQKKIIKVAQWYLKEKRRENAAVSFAVIAILWNAQQPEIRWIPNAFDITF